MAGQTILSLPAPPRALRFNSLAAVLALVVGVTGPAPAQTLKGPEQQIVDTLSAGLEPSSRTPTSSISTKPSCA